MKSFNLKISQIGVKKELKIIYEDGKNCLHKMNVSKDDILGKLRYYEKMRNEINQTNVIYIHEDIDFDIFAKFISSIATQEIDIDEKNYELYYYLSQKYEYEELQQELDNFIQERSDISSVIAEISSRPESLSKSENESMNSQINIEKEELISKNLDICIKNGNLKKLPLQMLNRILNSPKRVLKNHRLLFNFVIDLIKEKTKEILSNEELEDLCILPSSLDYCEMSSDEIEELLSIETTADLFTPRNPEKRMKMFARKEIEMSAKLQSIEEKISENENEYKAKIESLEKALENTRKSLEEIVKNGQKTTFQRISSIEENQQKYSSKLQLIESQVVEHNKKILNNENILSKFSQRIKFSDEKNDKNTIEKSDKISKEKSGNAIESQQIQSISKPLFVNGHNLINCENGIFQFLFDTYKSNPALSGLIEISGNSSNNPNQRRLSSIIDSNWDSDWMSKNEPNSFIKIDFKKMLVRVKKYRISVGLSGGGSIFTSWILKAVTEKNQEIILDEVKNTNEITKKEPQSSFVVHNDSFIRSIQLIMKGKSCDGDHYMLVRNIELFGDIKSIET